MKIKTLSEFGNQVSKIKTEQNLSHSQAQQILAKQLGFKTYQSYLSSLENIFIQDENEYMSLFKSNIFKNRKHIKSNFKKILYLQGKHDKTYDEEIDLENLRDEIYEEASKVSDDIAKLIFGDILYFYRDSPLSAFEGSSYAGYITSLFINAYNNINGEESDFFIQLDVEQQSFELSYRNVNVIEYEDIDHDGNTITKSYDEWEDWNEIDIELP